MAQLKRPRPVTQLKKRTTVPYASSGHPSAEELMAEQGTAPIDDVAALHGNFWPEDESIEEFVATYREWRGHKRNHSSA